MEHGGRGWTYEEAKIVFDRYMDSGISKEDRAAVGKLVGRSPGAIAWAVRQLEDGKVIGRDPKKAKNRMQRWFELLRSERLRQRRKRACGLCQREISPEDREVCRCQTCGSLLCESCAKERHDARAQR